MFNINKTHSGQFDYGTNHLGKKVARASTVFFQMPDEVIHEFDTVYDPDHFIYQNLMPITKEEYMEFQRTLGFVPKDRQGVCVMCSCGSEAVVITDNNAPLEIQGKAVCRHLMQFGIHQTSLIIKDGVSRLPDKIGQDKLYMDSDLKKILKPGDSEQ